VLTEINTNEDNCLLRNCTLRSDRSLRTFRRHALLRSLGCVSTCATTQLEACQYARRRSNDQAETCTSSRKVANTRTYLPVWERETCVTLRLPLAHPFCACLSSCILLPLRMQPTHVSHCMRSCTSGNAALGYSTLNIQDCRNDLPDYKVIFRGCLFYEYSVDHRWDHWDQGREGRWTMLCVLERVTYRPIL
jgi:hypothetical protein